MVTQRKPTAPRSKPAVPAAGVNWLALDKQLCFALYAASLAATKAYKPLLAPLALTYPQYLVMLVLWEGDGITVSHLGTRLQLDSGTLTPLLKRLEQQQRLVRQRDGQDERRVLLQLTPQGRALREQALAVPQALAAAAGCDLPQIQRLSAELKGLQQHLRDHPAEGVHRTATASTPAPSGRQTRRARNASALAPRPAPAAVASSPPTPVKRRH